MKLAVAGQGAFGVKHLEALQNIPDAEVISLAGGSPDSTREVAEKFGIPHWTTDLAETLQQPGLEAVILATPTQLHAAQAEQCMRAGKHVEIEIPIADNLADAERLVKVQQETGVVAMGGHTRRFNPSHQWIHNRIKAGELHIQQMDVQTYFFRRTNTNALGQPRSWTDHLLWHHACHTVDLFQYQTGEQASIAEGVQGPIHPQLGIAMDMGILMKVPSGAICTLSLSFNNDGPFGTFFRYICDNGTYIARYDDLFNGKSEPIDLSNVAVSMNGIELQDREFISAIDEHREPNASIAQCFTALQTLDHIDVTLDRSPDVKRSR
jgi:2-hydroxy-4-carboxymuconate semialdehyde hemiacetal dehydrogenase